MVEIGNIAMSSQGDSRTVDCVEAGSVMHEVLSATAIIGLTAMTMKSSVSDVSISGDQATLSGAEFAPDGSPMTLEWAGEKWIVGTSPFVDKISSQAKADGGHTDALLG